MNPKLVLPGGSGFLGGALALNFANQGWDVVILSRHSAASKGAIRTVLWDGRTAGAWAEEMEGAQAVVNLTGRSVACLRTPENEREILESRINSVRAVEGALAQCRKPPPVLVQASSLAIYGDPGDTICDEAAPRASEFPANVVEAWEHEFYSGVAAPGSRRVVLRIGFVLGQGGGALEPLARLTRRFMGGSAGSGRQFISWLHVDDFCEMCRWAIAGRQAQGTYNATGPVPVTNADFMRELRRTLGRPWSPPVPEWAVKFGARHVVHVDPELALGGRRCVPRRLLAEGFEFRYSDLAEALGDIFPQKKV